jgi:hypothetical protein
MRPHGTLMTSLLYSQNKNITPNKSRQSYLSRSEKESDFFKDSTLSKCFVLVCKVIEKQSCGMQFVEIFWNWNVIISA